ncbi:MAG: hypothetical protein ABMA26_15035 [Limisphaerales bacterium]
MLLNHRPTKILVSGASGTGKSTFFTRYLLNTKAHPVRIIYDHEGELAYRLGLEAITDRAGLADAIETGWVIYDPVKEFEGDAPAGFEWFCQWTFSVAKELRRPLLFACDELQKLLTTSSLPPEFNTLNETGRRYGVDWIFIGQATNLVHNRIRNQVTEVVTFRQADENAVKFLEDLGFEADELRGLEIGEYRSRSMLDGVTGSGRLF